jgi:hypothetical protein
MPYTGPYREGPFRSAKQRARWNQYRRLIAVNSVRRIWPPSGGQRLWVTIVNKRFLSARSKP